MRHFVLTTVALAAALSSCGDGRKPCATVVCEGTRICDESTGACVKVECLTDTQCSCPLSSCSEAHTCVAPTSAPTPGEQCSDAPVLRACSGLLNLQVDLSTMHDNLGSTCITAAGGNDATWSLVLDTTSDVRVTAKPSAGSSAVPTISLRSACSAGAEITCATPLASATSTSFRVKSLAAGRYLVIVDAPNDTSNGQLDVTVEVLAATLPANDLCGTAVTLPMDGTVQHVDLRDAVDDVQLAVNSAPDSPDVMYRFTLGTPKDVTITVAGDDAGVDSVIALRAAPCATGVDVAAVDETITAPEVLTVKSLDAGTWYVIVESYGRSTAGPVTVKAIASTPALAPSNDTCAQPTPLVFDGGVSSFTVDTSSANDDTMATCNAVVGGPEAVYSLTLDAGATVTVTSTPQTSSGDAVIYLRGGDCLAGAELACNDASPPLPDTFTTTALDAGTYWLFVESYGASGAGPTQVTVTVSP